MTPGLEVVTQTDGHIVLGTFVSLEVLSGVFNPGLRLAVELVLNTERGQSVIQAAQVFLGLVDNINAGRADVHIPRNGGKPSRPAS